MLTTKLIDNSFGNDGITAFCEGLKMNQSVTTLYLRSKLTRFTKNATLLNKTMFWTQKTRLAVKDSRL